MPSPLPGRPHSETRVSRLALVAALVAAGAAGLWLVLHGDAVIEPLLRRALERATVDPHDRWRVGALVAKLAPLYWPRAALVLAMAVATLTIALWARRRGPGLAGAAFGAGAAIVVWLATELLVAPFLIVPLGLQNYYFVLDVDHRFPPHEPGLGTNADGIRSAREAADFRPEDLNVLTLGDSFTYGLGVTADQAFPTLTETLLRRRLGRDDVLVANFGWPSASPLLGARQLAEIGARYHPDLVVYAVDMTDFYDELLYRQMLDRHGLYWWYDKTPIALQALHRLAPALFERVRSAANAGLPRQRFFATREPLEQTEPWLHPTVESLERVATISRDLGADFVAVVLPRCFQYSDRESPHNWEAGEYTPLGPYSLEPFRYFASIRDRLPFEVLSLLPAFQETELFPTCQDDDPHWNEAGHRVAAEALAPRLAAHLAEAGGGRAGAPPALGHRR